MFGKRMVRKGLLVAFLVAASFLVGEVYQRFSRQSPEEVLAQLHAQQVMTRSLIVNGQNVVADVWALPATSSVAPLRKAKGRVLIVGKLVYVFQNGGLKSLRGQCRYPADFPALEMVCDYVVDTGSCRMVSGSTNLSAEAVKGVFDASARRAGWTPLGANVWQKGKDTLFMQASEAQGTTWLSLAMQKE